MRFKLLIAALFVTFVLAVPTDALDLFHYDLQSLAYMSAAVIEGDVTVVETVHSGEKVTFKITRVYAGDFKEGATTVVGLNPYYKTPPRDISSLRFEKGDHLILFIEPVTAETWKADGIPFWLVASGLKLINDGKVRGVRQISNPGAYHTVISEGDVEPYRQKIADAVKWAAEFHKTFVERKSDVAWLLEQLEIRYARKAPPGIPSDYIAEMLDAEIAAKGDKAAIDRSKAMFKSAAERQKLDQNQQYLWPG